MRLIDADELMETIKAHDYPLKDHLNSTDNGMFTIGIQQAVDEQPTVDAVPVVRCGKCKHREEKHFWCEKVQDFISNPEWFCADGERKKETNDVLQGMGAP